MRFYERSLLWGAVFLLSVYFLSIGRGYYSTDGDVMFRLTWALSEHHSFGFPCDPSLPNAPQGPKGKCYSRYGLGQSLAWVPFYEVGKVTSWAFRRGDSVLMGAWFVRRANAIFTALAAFVTGLWAAEMFNSARKGVAAMFLFGLSTLAYPYSKFNFNQPLTSLCLLVSLYLLWSYGRTRGKGMLVWSGIAFGYGVFTRLTVVIALPLALLFLFVSDGGADFAERSKKAILWSVFPALFLGLSFAYNLVVFGGWKGGYAGEGWTTPILLGMYGLLMSSGKGVFLFVPVFALFPWGVYRLHSKGFKKESLVFLGLFVVYLLFYSPFWTWHGGWSWGPRFLVPLMPYISISAISLLDLPLGKLSVALAFLTGAAVQMLGVLVDFGKYMLLINDETKILFIPQYSPLVGHFVGAIKGTLPLDIAPADMKAFGISSPLVSWLLVTAYILIGTYAAYKVVRDVLGMEEN